ncbi:MAG: hypothetical protein K6B14_05535 [Lachnospiraceae bacterium]|nr:hypothetical protein [Lachnospiraceae bacterium]
MIRKITVTLLLTASMLLTSCGPAAETVLEKVDTAVLNKYKEMSAGEIVASLTLEQKAAQMVQDL